ncbi:MAG: hypothetical protein AAGD32_17710 [Planctomycetota bacterium]
MGVGQCRGLYGRHRNSDQTRHFFGRDRDIPYAKPNLQIERAGDTLTVTTDVLVRDLYVLDDKVESQGVHLLPGESVRVELASDDTPDVRCVNTFCTIAGSQRLGRIGFGLKMVNPTITRKNVSSSRTRLWTRLYLSAPAPPAPGCSTPQTDAPFSP